VFLVASCSLLWIGGGALADDATPPKESSPKEGPATPDADKDSPPTLAAPANDAKPDAAKPDDMRGTGEKAADEPADAKPADPNNPGQGDLDKATQLKVTAEGLADLNEVVDKLDSAIEKGLDKDNKAFAEQLLISTLLQRATALSSAILDKPVPDPRHDPRWLQIRQYALTDLQRAIALDGSLYEAQLLIGRLQALPLGDPNAAKRALSKVCDANDADPDQRAESYALRGTLESDDAKREADFNRAVELVPDKPDYYRVRAQFLYSKDKFDPALADVDQAIKMAPDHAASQELRGLILLGLKRDDEALAAFNKASELAPDAVLPYQHRGEVYREQGDLKKAVEQLTKALELAPGDAATLLLRASVYYQLNETDHALEDIEEAIRRQPQLFQAHLMRAELLAATKRVDQAVEGLERLLPLAPDQPKLLDPLATYYLIGGQPRKAIDTFTQLLAVEPENYHALRYRGDAYLNIGKHKEAIDDFEHALKSDDANNDDGLLNNYAWVLATSPTDNLRDGKKAIELATKAADLTSYQVPHVLSTLAAAYAETGDFDTAKKWSAKSIELADDEKSHDDPKDLKKISDDDKICDDLKKELASYEASKPTRELQQQEDEKPAAPPETSHTFAPPSATPAPARTLDF
jgi:tetratricopeptide (TPR) repeat protein